MFVFVGQLSSELYFYWHCTIWDELYRPHNFINARLWTFNSCLLFICKRS